MAKLNAASRAKISSGDFAGPARSYPIPDKSHARNALARAAQNATPALKNRITAKVRDRFPSIEVEGKACGGRADRAPRGKR